jgi:four helix bundle protein
MERACRKLEIYRLGHELGVAVHRMTLELPDFERFEEGSQVRRSSKRVSACIVEGHTLRKYKLLYLNFLYRALASADETQEHLDYLRETGSLKDKVVYKDLSDAYRRLSGKLFRFIQAVERHYETPRYANRKADVEELDPDGA